MKHIHVVHRVVLSPTSKHSGKDELETFSLFINTWMAFSALSLPFCISVKRLNNKGLLLWAMGQDFLAKLEQRYFTEEIFVSLFSPLLSSLVWRGQGSVGNDSWQHCQSNRIKTRPHRPDEADQWGCPDWSPNEYLLLFFENILMGGLYAPLKCCSVLGFKQSSIEDDGKCVTNQIVILNVTTTRPMKNMKVLKLHSYLCSGSKHNTWAYR